MGAFAGIVFELMLFFLVDVLFLWTGEVIVFLCTFGRRKPVFRMWRNKTSASPAPAAKASHFIGLAFWIVVLLVFRFLPD